jgi:hypothetical protein
MIHYLEKDARLSDCKKYRYLLRRTWDYDKPRLLVIMLNPSTADGEDDDATIRSLVRICTALGFGSFEVVNLFAYRATDPEELAEVDNPIGHNNDNVIEAAVGRCDLIVCAWGSHPMANYRGEVIRFKVRSLRPAVFCLGTNKLGGPKHPLYIKTGTPLVRYGT